MLKLFIVRPFLGTHCFKWMGKRNHAAIDRWCVKPVRSDTLIPDKVRYLVNFDRPPFFPGIVIETFVQALLLVNVILRVFSLFITCKEAWVKFAISGIPDSAFTKRRSKGWTLVLVDPHK